jgi:predicted CXXCH cytochrome family protein
VKSLKRDTARRARVRAVVAFPVVTVALAVSVALVLTPFGPSQVSALAASAPIDTSTPSPTSTSTPGPTTTPTPSATTSAAPAPTTGATPSPAPLASPTPQIVAAPAAALGDHHVLALIAGPTFSASYFPVDTDVVNASQFQTFRVRFSLQNVTAADITVTPQLEFSQAGGAKYDLVPNKPELTIPLHVSHEWIPSLLGGGTVQSPLGEDIASSTFTPGTEGLGSPFNGHHSMGANPDQPITLPSASYTEEEFTVTLSIDAKYQTDYWLRITNAGIPVTSDVAVIGLGAAPPVQLSPGQHQGVAVVDPTTTSAAGVAFPLLSTPVKLSSTAPSSAAPAVSSPGSLTYPLTASKLSAASAINNGIHGPYSITTDECAVCHSGHSAQAPNLLVKGSQSGLCFTCHGAAAGATTNVQNEYALVRPVNTTTDTQRDYYSHDAETASKHTQSQLDEFGGVANRHSSCADCHNSHRAKVAPDSTQTTKGWDASGSLAGVSGVSVVNDAAAGSTPTYTFLDGATQPITLEYQLCFKCHSGFTKLLPPIAGKPSMDELDKGVEFNPNNPSFHPIEAPGTNQTAKMDLNLKGTSPDKLWNFNVGSTIRCLNCHTSSETPAAPPLPLPGSALQPHTSTNRGILLRNYLDRDLKPRVDSVAVKAKAAYSSGDFALCYTCHGEEPFANPTSPFNSNATNFSLHGQHLDLLAGKGDGAMNIDKAGDGQGNAICAECHFRIHSTTNKVGAQVIPGSRLVNFAPNVQPSGGAISWTPSGTSTPGSCTLTCHGYTHDALKY